jgi:L-lactate dehydrogenase (cytochrome)
MLHGFISGAVETDASLRDNRDAFAEWGFVPRVLVDTSGRSTVTELLGRRYAAPFGIAPMGASALSAYRGDLVFARAAAAAASR